MSERRRRTGRRGGDGNSDPTESDWDENVYVKHDDESPPGPPAASTTKRTSANVSRVFRPSRGQRLPQQEDNFRDEEVTYDDDEEEENFDMSVAELLYSTSSFYAIIVPGTKWPVFCGSVLATVHV